MKLIPLGFNALPIIHYGGNVPAGFPSPATDYMEDDIDLSKYLVEHPNATIYFRIEGESMTGAFIPDKSIVIVDRTYRGCHGNHVVCVLNGEFTCKTLWREGSRWWLRPENSKFKPILLTEEMEFKVVGVVTCVIYKPNQILSTCSPS
jgi:DNA polymerase V